MIRLALTGSIGMGKSTVAAMFAKRGVPVFDADLEVRALQAPGGALAPKIAERWPHSIRNGALDRDLLASAVLGQPAELAALEALMHPAVGEARERFITQHEDAPALLFDIPLLFETGAEGSFDRIITVSAPLEVQRQRVLARPGMSVEKLEAILARQVPDAEKRARSDFVVDTGTSLADTERQVDAILACLGIPGAQ